MQLKVLVITYKALHGTEPELSKRLSVSNCFSLLNIFMQVGLFQDTPTRSHVGIMLNDCFAQRLRFGSQLWLQVEDYLCNFGHIYSVNLLLCILADEMIVSSPLRNEKNMGGLFGEQVGYIYIYSGNQTTTGHVTDHCKSWTSPCPEDWVSCLLTRLKLVLRKLV